MGGAAVSSHTCLSCPSAWRRDNVNISHTARGRDKNCCCVAPPTPWRTSFGRQLRLEWPSSGGQSLPARHSGLTTLTNEWQHTLFKASHASNCNCWLSAADPTSRSPDIVPHKDPICVLGPSPPPKRLQTAPATGARRRRPFYFVVIPL